MRNRYPAKSAAFRWIFILAISLIIMAIVSLCLGETFISPVRIIKIIASFDYSLEKDILLFIRLPRIILAIAAGALLSLCGVVMQATVQNPLADPFLLGVSSGATLGMTFYLMLGVGIGTVGMPFFSFLGAFLSILLVLFFSRRHQSSPVVLVLIGTIINSLAAALSNFLIYYSGDSEKIRMVTFWTMGSLSSANWRIAIFIFATLIVGIAFFYRQATVLDGFLLGSQTATTLGINVKFYRFIYVAVISVLSGILVSQCGIIGFVGLIIPHFSRIIVGSNHKRLLPASCIMGSLFLLFTDTLARTLVPGGEIPIGVITALIGSPVFLLLIKHKQYQFGGN